MLIEKGADVDAKNNDGGTALHWAALNEHIDIAKILIENGANINAKDKDGETALEIAIRFDHHQIAELIENSKKAIKIDSKNIDILSMDMLMLRSF